MTPDELIKEQQRKEELKLRKRNKQFKIIVIIMMVVSYGLSGFLFLYNNKIDKEPLVNINTTEIQPNLNIDENINSKLEPIYEKINDLNLQLSALQNQIVANNEYSMDSFEIEQRERVRTREEYRKMHEGKYIVRSKDWVPVTEENVHLLNSELEQLKFHINNKTYIPSYAKWDNSNTDPLTIIFKSTEIGEQSFLAVIDEKTIGFENDKLVLDDIVKLELIVKFTQVMYDPEGIISSDLINVHVHITNNVGFAEISDFKVPKELHDFFTIEIVENDIYFTYIKEK